MDYHPPQDIIDKYADLLVNYALGSGQGIKSGDVVSVCGSEASRPLYIACVKAVWDAGGHVIGRYSPDTYSEQDNLDRYFYERATPDQLTHFRRDYLRGLAREMDHQLVLLSDTNIHALEGIDPAKILQRGLASKPYSEWLEKKESAGKFTWTLGLYGTEALAKEAGLSLEEYWQQIIRACFLDTPDPVATYRATEQKISDTVARLDSLPIDRLHVTGADVDLWMTLGEKRKWVGGGGRNIPSFEIFTSPDWRDTDGWIRFNQPLYIYGSIIEGVELHFQGGKVTKSTATKNQKLLREMISTKNADKIGEFSLTDADFSKITHFMAETLYDENIGGQFGNTHIAVGNSYHDCYDGDPSSVKKSEWTRLGFNDSSVHTDIVSTTDRTVTAILTDGSEKIIYKSGHFTLD